METLVGQTLNRYQITSMLGEGGMGAVYKARDVTLQRDVAIKVMHAQFTRQQNFQERFLQEARVAARLDHPGIVKVYDFGEARGMLYIVMEFIPGQNLRKMEDDLRKSGQWILLDESVKIVRQVCLALGVAHKAGIFHRDIKPDNIMLKPEPSDGLPFRPVLTDLGLARLAAGGVMTQDGTTMGTPAYMSPEQAMGQKTNACSDVYSLGILLYEMAAGQLPFPVRTLSEAIRYHTQEPPPDPRSIRPDLPAALVQVIMKAISKKPADRYQSAGEMAVALSETVGPAAKLPVQTNLANAVSLVTQLQKSAVEPRGPSLAESFPKVPDNIGRDRVQILEKDQTGKTMQMKPSGMTIGRDEDNDIPIHDTKVSRHHARIEFDGSNYRVSDLNSTNGTYLGSTRLLPGISEIWTPDKFIQIGDAFLRLERATQSGGAPPQVSGLGGRSSGQMRLANGTTVDPAQVQSSAGGHIGIFLDPGPLTVAPGSSTTVSLMVLNQGPVVDKFSLSVSGIPANWVSQTSPIIQLMPGDQREAVVNIRPPQDSKSRAGRYQVVFRAASQVDTSQFAEARTSLTVQPFSRFTSEMRPQRVRTNQPARITINNQGNLQETFQIEWEDRGNELAFYPPVYRVSVAEGQSAVVEFRASPRQRQWVGGEKMTPFTAKVAASTGDPETQSGELVSRAPIPPWLLAIVPVLFACLLGAFALGLFQINGQKNAQTQTAVAVANNLASTENAAATQVVIVISAKTQAAQGTIVAGSALQTAQAAAAALTEVAVAQT